MRYAAYRNSQVTGVGVFDSDTAYVDNRTATSNTEFDSALAREFADQQPIKTN